MLGCVTQQCEKSARLKWALVSVAAAIVLLAGVVIWLGVHQHQRLEHVSRESNGTKSLLEELRNELEETKARMVTDEGNLANETVALRQNLEKLSHGLKETESRIETNEEDVANEMVAHNRKRTEMAANFVGQLSKLEEKVERMPTKRRGVSTSSARTGARLKSSKRT